MPGENESGIALAIAGVVCLMLVDLMGAAAAVIGIGLIVVGGILGMRDEK